MAARRSRLLLGLLVLAVPLGLMNSTCAAPLVATDLGRVATALTTDGDLELARRYAPWIYHAVHPTKGRQDIPTRVDFDGDLRGDNNWETFPHFELPPTVYYAVLETETHLFLTYHLFHPRDWEHVRLGLHLTHENDGENLQVVVDKAREEVVLLFTQAHYCGGVYVPAGSDFGDGEEEIRGPLLLLDEEGVPAAGGRHAGVYVELRGHGIYGALDSSADVTVSETGEARFDCGGLVMRPARPGEAIVEPAVAGLDAETPASVVPYQLESITAKLWPGLADGSLVGEGGLLDGAYVYECPRLRVDVPRFYEADRFSGPFGPDRGISPFAVDFGFDEGELGALFFDPARRYAEQLAVPEPWSLDYVDDPFTR